MGLAHPLLPETCASPFPVPALHVVHKKAPSPTVSNPMARFLPRNPQVFFSPLFISCGTSGRGRVEECLGQGCLPAPFLSYDRRILT